MNSSGLVGRATSPTDAKTYPPAFDKRRALKTLRPHNMTIVVCLADHLNWHDNIHTRKSYCTRLDRCMTVVLLQHRQGSAGMAWSLPFCCLALLPQLTRTAGQDSVGPGRTTYYPHAGVGQGPRVGCLWKKVVWWTELDGTRCLVRKGGKVPDPPWYVQFPSISRGG